MAMRIANYLVILKDVRTHTHGEEPGDPLQRSNSHFEFWLLIRNHQSWGMFTRPLQPSPLHQTFVEMITRPEWMIRPESITT